MAVGGGVPVIRYDLAQPAVVSRVISATQFVSDTLAGDVTGTYVGYSVWVLSKVNATATPPKGEPPAPISAFAGPSSTQVPPGTVTHAAFTANLAVGDMVLLLNPGIAAAFSGGSGITPVRGTVTANWQAAEQNLISLGTAGVARKIESLIVDINGLAGNITIRLYAQVNGVERRIYPVPAATTFTVVADAPAIPVIDGTMGIYGLLRVTVQSDNVADNGVAVAYEAN